MGLSLAQSSRKKTFQADPRNTQWANDTNRFGHQQLIQMGWKPGRGLGSSVEGVREHVKVRVKTDSKGLGAQGSLPDIPTGLDVFQRILGKLNGNEEAVEQEQQKRQQLRGLYLQFVPGGVLEGSVKVQKDKKETKAIKKENEKSRKNPEKSRRKAEKAVKVVNKELKEKTKSKKQKQHDAIDSDTTEKSTMKQKTDEVEYEAKQTPPQTSYKGIRATRSRYIAMKRKATEDSQSLKEILML